MSKASSIGNSDVYQKTLEYSLRVFAASSFTKREPFAFSGRFFVLHHLLHFFFQKCCTVTSAAVIRLVRFAQVGSVRNLFLFSDTGNFFPEKSRQLVFPGFIKMNN